MCRLEGTGNQPVGTASTFQVSVQNDRHYKFPSCTVSVESNELNIWTKRPNIIHVLKAHEILWDEWERWKLQYGIENLSCRFPFPIVTIITSGANEPEKKMSNDCAIRFSFLSECILHCKMWINLTTLRGQWWGWFIHLEKCHSGSKEPCSGGHTSTVENGWTDP